MFWQFEIPIVAHPDSAWAASIATRVLSRMDPGDTSWVVEDLQPAKDYDSSGSPDGFIVLVRPAPKPNSYALGGDVLLWIGTRGRAQILAGYQ